MDLWPRTADLLRGMIFLRPGLRLALILAVALFALVIGIGSALVEFATVTRLQVNATTRRGDLATGLVLSQVRYAIQNTSGSSPREIMARDDGIGLAMADARALIPGVVEVMVTDTANVVIRATQPGLAGQVRPSGTPLVSSHGMGLLTQGFSLMRVREPFEVTVDFGLDNRRFGTVRATIDPGLLRSEMQQVFLAHLVKVSLQVLLAALFAIAVSWLVVLRPLGRIGAGLERLERGEFGARLDVAAGDDIGQLARQVNAISEMMAREREQFLHQRDEGDTLRRLVDAVDDGLIMIDADRVILMANRPAMNLLGGDGPTLVGRRLASILPPDSPLIAAVNSAFAGESRLESAPLEFATPIGPRVLLTTCQLAGDAGGREGAMITLRDYGRLQRIREMLDHARVLSTLGRMAAGVAHEVRNPLNAMNIQLRLLKDKLPPSSGQDGGARHLELVQGEIVRLERVVSGFLRLARIKELALSHIDVGEFLGSLVELVQPEARMAGIDLVLAVAPGVPDLYGDEEILRQAFLNLLRNAIQATPAGGPPVEISASPRGTQVCLMVVDQGQGMTAEVRDRAFNLYFTTRKEGSGVGLALVQQAVEMHGGRIELESDPGRGTTFTICIPSIDGN